MGFYPHGPKPCASTNSAIPALKIILTFFINYKKFQLLVGQIFNTVFSYFFQFTLFISTFIKGRFKRDLFIFNSPNLIFPPSLKGESHPFSNPSFSLSPTLLKGDIEGDFVFMAI